jgi:hypothetical protein
MVFISKLWEGEDVFFNIRNHDLTLCGRYSSCFASLFFVFCHKLCELITSIIVSLLVQYLKPSFHPRVLDSSTHDFQKF